MAALPNRQFRPLNWRNAPGLAIWLDAQDSSTIALSGSNVTQWSDKSGNGNHAVQATAIRQPLLVASAINGHPAIQGRHDGSNASQLDIADAASLNYTGFTSFVVIQRVTDLGTEQIINKYAVTGNQREFQFLIDPADFFATTLSADGTATTSNSLTTPTVVIGTPVIRNDYYDGTNINLRRISNGSDVSATPVARSANYQGTGKLTLFAREDFAAPYAGYIGEVLFFTRSLSATEQAVVIAYLKSKWGIV